MLGMESSSLVRLIARLPSSPSVVTTDNRRRDDGATHCLALEALFVWPWMRDSPSPSPFRTNTITYMPGPLDGGR